VLLWWRDQTPHLDAASHFKPILRGNLDRRGRHSIQEALQTNINHQTKQKQFRMKKIKWSILSLAFVFSICAAFATKPHWDCSTLPQYFFNGSGYIPVSSQYACLQGSTTCTYYTLNGGITYSPCTVGTYDNCAGCVVKTQQTSTNAGH
jgi:hypothetical protein